MVTRCLEAVFDDPYTFHIAFQEKRGKTDALLYFERAGRRVEPDAGGVDVAAFALRLACLMLTRPPLRRVLILDEPFKHLSAGLKPMVASLLEELSREMGVQIIMVTHDAAFQAGVVVQVER